MPKKYFLPILLLFLLGGIPVFGQKLPDPAGPVNDFAGVLDPRSAASIDALSRALLAKTGVSVVVATVESIEPYGSVEQYSIDLATKWGIGSKKEDNGALLLLAVKERRVRLEVGRGLEGIIPDGLAGQIIDESVIPSFRAGEYGQGMLRGVQAVAGIVADEYGVQLSDYDLRESHRYVQGSGRSPLFFLFLILALLFMGGRWFFPILLFGSLAGRRMYHSRGFYGGGFGSGGGGFGGGGFGGFGGGGFGGGGASRGF
jgi:uncharacterized protein